MTPEYSMCGAAMLLVIAAALGYLMGCFVWWYSFARHFGASLLDVIIGKMK